MNRREFLGIAVAGAAGVAGPLRAAKTAAERSALARPRLLAILRDESTVRELGVRYRELAPHENDVEVLTANILPAANISDAALVARVEEEVRRDFTDGRTVNVDGWILAVTEARQCALFSLVSA